MVMGRHFRVDAGARTATISFMGDSGRRPAARGAREMAGKKRAALTKRGESLLRISLAINAGLELEKILQTIVLHLRDLLGCEDASIILWDRRQTLFRHGASTNVGPVVPQRVRREGGATRWVVDHGKPVVVPDTRRDPFTANPMILAGGVMAYTGVPITHGGEVVGVLYALYSRLHKATPDDLWLMSQAAAMAAIAIHNSRMLRSLEELNDFKSAMIRMLVHDLNNIIQALGGGIDILRFLNRNMDTVDMELVDASMNRMRQLVNGILRYEKMTSVEEIERKPLDLNAVAADAVSALADAAARKSHRLAAALSPSPCAVYGDRLLLQEAAFNLISNAVNYTPAGGRIAVRTKAAPGGCVLEVSDNGPGIAPGDQARIFRPFVRLRREGQVKGSGLGLYLVRTIAERHGGRIALAGAPGKGAVFTLFIPAPPPT